MADKEFILRNPLPEQPEAPQLDLFGFISEEWKDFPDEIALIGTGENTQELTYRQLSTVVDKVSRDLSEAGVRVGTIVAVWCSNCVELVVVSCAAWKIGATAAYLGASLTPEEVQRQIKILKTTYFFIDQRHAPLLNTLFGEFNLQLAFEFGTRRLVCVRTSDKSFTRTSDIVRPQDNVAMILFSSGTTGYPKAVQLTQSNILYALACSTHKYTESKLPASLIFLPMTHFYGLITVVRSLVDCSTSIIMPRFDLEDYLALIVKYQVVLLFLVPPVAVMLTKRPELLQKYDLSCVMAIFTSGAPMASETQKELERLLPDMMISLRHGYGMTETTGALTSSPVKPYEHPSPPSSVGLANPFLEIRVVDPDTGRPCGPHTPGELTARGPTVMKGYLGDTSATDAIIDKDGWLHTGDIGYYDEYGYVFVVDRIKELIKNKGMQVAPAELEDLLLSHPDVADAAVVGLPDELAGELPLGFVVRKQGSRVTEKEIQQFIAGHVAPFKQLSGGVRFIPAIPKSLTGKILRRTLVASLTSTKL